MTGAACVRSTLIAALVAAVHPWAARAQEPGASAHLGASAAQRPTGDVYAIVIGYNGVGRSGVGATAGLPVLRYADDDAVRFSMLLRGLDGAARPQRVWLLTELDAQTAADLAAAGLAAPPDAAPTRTTFQSAMADVGTALGRRSDPRAPALLYIIYAGHGLQGRILLKPEAGGVDAALTGHEIRAALANLTQISPALRTLLFVDACRSQSLFTERGAGSASDLGPDLSARIARLEERAGAVSLGILTAAASGKPAGEVTALGAGFFSHVLASGLAGGADADGDDVISFGELVAFVAFNTERLTGQRPWFAPPEGDLGSVVIDHRGNGTKLDLATSPPGRYMVEAKPGRPVFAEIFKGERGPRRLTLPPGTYRVLHVMGDDRARLSHVRLAAGERLTLASASWGDPVIVSASFPRGQQTPASSAGQPVGSPAVGAVAEIVAEVAPQMALDSTLAFAAPLTPEVVSTLTAGYDAGREPLVSTDGGRASLGVAVGAGAAPLNLGGTETAVLVRYRQTFGHFFLAGRATWGRSSYQLPQRFDLDRYGITAEGGPRWAPMRWVELGVGAGLGAARVVRRGADGAVSGDPFAPAVGGSVSVDIHVGHRWWLYAQGRYAWQWIEVDATRRVSSGGAGELGVAWVF